MPKGPLVRYLKLTSSYVAKFQALVEAHVYPLVTDAVGPKYAEATSAVAIALDNYVDREYAPGLTEVFGAIDEFNRKEMSRTMRVEFGKLGVEARRRQWVKDNVALIKSVSFERLEDMRKLLEANVTEQTHPSALRAQLQDEFGLTKARADLIARDQTLKLNAQIGQERAKSVGVTSYTWITSRDERVRGNPNGKYAKSASNHWDLHGKVFSYADPPVTNPRTGERNHPGEDYQCRCVAVPNTDELLGL